MDFKKTLVSLILLMCILLSACASSAPAEPEASSVETEMTAETEATTAEETAVTTTAKVTDAAETSPEKTTAEEEETEKETYVHLGITDGILKYEDVRGYFFRTEFHGDWPENDYDQSAFEMVDGRMTYSGEGYTYRLGVDVYDAYSHVDWKAVKDDGYEFAIIRLGYRGYAFPSLERDGMVINNLHGAITAGLDVGVYFFSQAIDEEEAEEEAEFVIKTLMGDGYTPEYINMGVAYDPEYIGSRLARSTDLTGEQITKNARAFCEKIRKAGYKALIYSNMVWEDRNFDLSELADIDIWYADYTAYPQSPYQFTIWQYGHGEAEGVDGAVDVNIEMIPVRKEPETSEEAGQDEEITGAVAETADTQETQEEKTTAEP